jgi:hypothetical protein
MHSHSLLSKGLFIGLASHVAVGATAFLTGLHVKHVLTTAFVLGADDKLRKISRHIKIVEEKLSTNKSYNGDVYKKFYDNVRELFELPVFDPSDIDNYGTISDQPLHNNQEASRRHNSS